MRHRCVGSDLRLDETGEGVDRLNCSLPGATGRRRMTACSTARRAKSIRSPFLAACARKRFSLQFAAAESIPSIRCRLGVIGDHHRRKGLLGASPLGTRPKLVRFLQGPWAISALIARSITTLAPLGSPTQSFPAADRTTTSVAE